MEKICTKCKEVKPATLEFFNKSKIGVFGLKPRCKKCTSEDGKEYHKANRDRIAKSNREHYHKNIEARRAKIREYARNNSEGVSKRSRSSYNKNRSEILLRNRETSKSRYKTDPIYKLRLDLSKQLRSTLTGRGIYTKKSRMYEIVGLTGIDLVIYLWGTFEANYGMPREWINLKDVEIDHITPKSTAKTLEEVKKLNHYTNLQLLFKEDNALKHTKLYVKGDKHECTT